MNHILKSTFLLGSLLLVPSVYSQGFSVGIAAGTAESPYKDYDEGGFAFPNISYEDDLFYIRGMSAGLKAYSDDKNQLAITVSYDPFSFDPDKTDDQKLRRLDKRDATLMAGFQLTHNENWGSVKAGISGDTLNNSNGMKGDLAYLYRFAASKAWTLTPMLGAEWNSKKTNSYYYGIASTEALRSGLSTYNTSDSWQPYLALSTRYAINKKWDTSLSAKIISLSDEIKNSPMVDQSDIGQFSISLSYHF